MDLLSQIEARKKKLKATTTILTNEAGERYEIYDGVERKLKEKRLPFVVDEKPDMQIARITEGLFLSSQDPVTNEESLKNHCIRHVLSLGIKVPVELDGIKYHFVDFLDLPEFEISTVIPECLRIIHECKRDNILVHCNAGVSRSATIVIAYLMATENFKYEEAYERVKSLRTCIRPNDGFVKQLQSILNLKSMLSEKYSNHIEEL
ncbi:dual specificity protein phosphatase 19-like [Venturia canescens]|uniref:dual specificity protein phosphatase 19-like n=1 Tax=Venturia canescens TaxID=32260 RepID=UPI001C9C5295|nr:dual specificity protein phosphatase 19-like [Venturia canescens]